MITKSERAKLVSMNLLQILNPHNIHTFPSFLQGQLKHFQFHVVAVRSNSVWLACSIGFLFGSATSHDQYITTVPSRHYCLCMWFCLPKKERHADFINGPPCIQKVFVDDISTTFFFIFFTFSHFKKCYPASQMDVP